MPGKYKHHKKPIPFAGEPIQLHNRFDDSVRERGLMLTLFPNPLFYPMGQRKLASFIYVLHLVLAIMFGEIVIGLYATVFAGVPIETLEKLFSMANWMFGASAPILLAVFAASNVAAKFSMGGDGGQQQYVPPPMPGGYNGPQQQYNPNNQGGQQGTINIKVGGGTQPEEGGLGKLPVEGEG